MAMDSSGVEIKVQPDVLNAKASDVSTSISQMEQLFDTVQTTPSQNCNVPCGYADNRELCFPLQIRVCPYGRFPHKREAS